MRSVNGYCIGPDTVNGSVLGSELNRATVPC